MEHRRLPERDPANWSLICGHASNFSFTISRAHDFIHALGYSSLGYLRKFPLDALKIDQSFVRQISTAPDDTTIVTAIISMGRSLNLRVIAEGVETQDELAFLQAHQCDEAQGYYFGRPVHPEQFAKLLETGVRNAVMS